ncbi:MAG: sulfatase-like hydrolase/transferase [Planctomycetota bacterium]|nr:sulfatase-like hydrolase/transferase [Planctomycetota bacterium]
MNVSPEKSRHAHPLIASLFGAAVFVLSSATGAAGRPNVILCMADDQGWGDVAYNGHPALQTPHLDAMAAAGLRFDRFYAAAPVCSPTRGSVLTGRHPNRFGCFSWGHTLRPQEITLAEALKAAGYATGHFGKWHLGSVCEGSPVNPGASGFDRWFSAPNFFDNDPILSREGIATPTRGESSMVTVDAALEFIRERAGGDRPFFAVIWFGSPHRPHHAAEEDLARYMDEPPGVRDFYGEITGIDRAVGRLRRELRTLNIHENTILWYCSDNGGLKTDSSGGRGRKGSIYEGGLRVPAILQWPARLPAARTTGLPCTTSDIYPTLLDLLGVRIDNRPPLDGISLAPLIDGRMNARPAPIGFWKFDAPGRGVPSNTLMTELLQAQQAGHELADKSRLRLDAAVISRQYPADTLPGHAAWLDWPWKLHRIEDRETGVISFELYNLMQDPGEQHDVAAENEARLETMKSALRDWQRSVVRSLNGEDYR